MFLSSIFMLNSLSSLRSAKLIHSSTFTALCQAVICCPLELLCCNDRAKMLTWLLWYAIIGYPIVRGLVYWCHYGTAGVILILVGGVIMHLK
jgi:hypothetical protein